MKKKFIWGILIVVLLFVGLVYISEGTVELQGATAAPSPILQAPVTKLEITDTAVGTGDEVASGDRVVMHYKGTLLDGTEFDSSYKRNEPFETTIGIGEVIKGWDEGIPGMKVGGKRKLVIPANMAYGEAGSPPAIPPNSPLVFEVELLEIK